jgi:Transglutaminase-like superfamily
MTDPTRRRGQAPAPAAPPRREAAKTARRRHHVDDSSVPRETISRVKMGPPRNDFVDAAGCLLLALLAFLGLGHTYLGLQYLVVAMAGVLLGGLLSYAAYLLRQPLIVLVAVGVVAFFGLGGALALRHDPAANAVPTGATLTELAHLAVHGWKDLLTTLPPVDGTGPLLVLPYLLGLFTGLGSIALATRTRAAFAPVVVPFLTLVVVILIAWAAARAGRLRPVTPSGSGRVTRMATAAVALALAGLGAAALGPNLPGSGSHDRLVLRKYVVATPNVGNYPSPLVEFRNYRVCNPNGQGLAPATSLFTVNGSFPAGTAIRFATMDVFNGTVWEVSNDPNQAQPRPNAFLKVGSTIDNPSAGRSSTLSISIPSTFAKGYSDYWMPSAGDLQRISFAGSDAEVDARDFRYNLATGTGLVPGSLVAGDSYQLRVADTVPALLAKTSTLSSGGTLPQIAGVPLDFVDKTTTSLAQPVNSVATRILNVGTTLKAKGKDTDCQPDYQYYLAGQSAGRLQDYADGLGGENSPLMLGDNEQSAAFYALMIEDMGVPARVVVGVNDPKAVLPGHTITTADVTAWVEVEAANQNWLTIPASVFDPTNPPDKQQQQQQQANSADKLVPPPAQGRPKTPLDDANDANSASTSTKKALHHGAGGSLLPAWAVTTIKWGVPPIAAIVGAALLIVVLKSNRRRRRASRGSPADRVARGWREVLDYARDLGCGVAARRTRVEQAQRLPIPAMVDLARQTDATTFGPNDPTDADARAYWQQVRATREQLGGTVGRWRRVRAAISLVSFRKIAPDSGLK